MLMFMDIMFILLTFSPSDAAHHVKIVTTEVFGRSSTNTSPLEVDVGVSCRPRGQVDAAPVVARNLL